MSWNSWLFPGFSVLFWLTRVFCGMVKVCFPDFNGYYTEIHEDFAKIHRIIFNKTLCNSIWILRIFMEQSVFQIFKRSQLSETNPDRGDILVEFTEQDKAESGIFCLKKANWDVPEEY